MGNLSNFWTLKTKQKHSWLANKLLKVREEAYNWIKLRVGNGKNARFWTDNWSPFGKLVNYLTIGAPSRMGIPSSTTLNDLYSQGNWVLPSARSENQVTLQAYLSTLTLDDNDDSFEWEVDGKIWNKYSTGNVYKLIKGHKARVPWNNLIWNSGGIPKHSFLSWLFVLNRCPTKDRIITWGLTIDPLCLLCNQSP